MHALCGERLLAACDQAQSEHALLRAVTLLHAAMPERARSDVLSLPIAERNRLLLRLRQMSFGPVLDGYAGCTQCGVAMEFRLAVSAALEGLNSSETSVSVDWMENGEPFHLRQATTEDLLSCLHAPSDRLAEERVLARCLGFDDTSGRAVEQAALPSVRARFDQLHAPVELRCTLCCPQCAHAETWELDIAHFVWLEARQAARRLMTDIHTLARHYSWSEPAIAGMSQSRRDAYLELLGA